MAWQPHVTVASLVTHQDKFLIVEEEINNNIVFNQPAGHWEHGESLMEAAIRETWEETGLGITITELLGTYIYAANAAQTYLRFCFIGHPTTERIQPLIPKDPDIIAAHWLDRKTLESRAAEMRSPLVMQCIHDYAAGIRYPLSLIQHF